MTIDEAGYAVIAQAVPPDVIANLLSRSGNWGAAGRGGARNLLDDPAIRVLARSEDLRMLVESVLGAGCFAVRALYFDKTPDANWKVPWHQDLVVPVRERVNGAAGYGAWSVKAGVVHVEPPVSVLEGMVAVRIHLDGCGPDNGPLRVRPGSHLAGRRGDPAATLAGSQATCCVGRGGVILMRPLLVHSSSAAKSPSHRRVIHIEFAACELPGVVEWRDRV